MFGFFAGCCDFGGHWGGGGEACRGFLFLQQQTLSSQRCGEVVVCTSQASVLFLRMYIHACMHTYICVTLL